MPTISRLLGCQAVASRWPGWFRSPRQDVSRQLGEPDRCSPPGPCFHVVDAVAGELYACGGENEVDLVSTAEAGDGPRAQAELSAATSDRPGAEADLGDLKADGSRLRGP